MTDHDRLKANIDKGLVDLAEGRVRDFDIRAIEARGNEILAQAQRPTVDTRRAYTIEELPDEWVEALKVAKMDERHDDLNHLMD